MLKYSNYKKALLDFLAEEWKQPTYAPIIGQRELYVGLGDHAWLYTCESGIVTRQPVSVLRCSHYEADTRVVWHIKHISETNTDAQSNVVVRCDDTDILVTLLVHVANMPVHIWMDVGKSGNNTRRYIDVTLLASHLGSDMTRALPGFHAFTGCDYTAAFFRKGKVRPLSIMEKGDFVTSFGMLGESETLPPTVIVQLESFTCTVYGNSRLNSTNEARYSLFCDKLSPKCHAQPMDKIKKVEPSMLPPSKPALMQKIKRANLVASMWKGANKETPCTWKPENNGWKLTNRKYELFWYDSNQMPDTVCSHIDEDVLAEEDDTVQDYCSSSDESDSSE